MKPLIVAMIAILLSVNSLLATEQSLGDLAQAEAERRKAIQTPSKVIREGDLEPAGPVTPTSIPVDCAVAAGSAIPERVLLTAVNVPPEAKLLSRDFSYWLGRMRELRTKQDRQHLDLAALQDRVTALVGDFNATHDRLQRAMIEHELQKVRTDRNLVLSAVVATDRQIGDLQGEARRSNVPPGWLRP